MFWVLFVFYCCVLVWCLLPVFRCGFVGCYLFDFVVGRSVLVMLAWDWADLVCLLLV